MYLLFIRKRKRKELTFTEKNKQKERKYIKERKKRKKEFFLIRQQKEKERSQRARVCTYTQRRSPRPFAAVQITTNDRKKPLTVFEPKDKPTDRKTLVLFSKPNRPSLVF